ncbi:MAG: penicillin acylase family protein [Gammaproteobacteria bacterium]|nr:penicillin acylase family protein [Gammaproteobacteria bacterium]
MRTLRYLVAIVLLLAAVLFAGAYALLRASLPQLDGHLRVAGLGAPVTVTRDGRGVPTLTAATRVDLAFATGFVHAQDRFFQMDLSRRLAAGELAELFGAVALEEDRRTRLFRFRSVARAVVAAASPAERSVFASYARGVNAGLASLGARPWEYWLLSATPAPWTAEDTVLVEYAMWWDLQANGLQREIQRREINARLGGPECAAGWKCALEFLYPIGTSWDAPDASDRTPPPAPQAPIPEASALDVRSTAAAIESASMAAPEPLAGSNNFAVAGGLTASGAALIANDMHLGQRVPPVWYHARLRVAAPGAAALDLNGVTLPGAPLLVAGSNGHIAWGFTNSYGDWLDVERVPCTPLAAAALSTPDGPVTLAVTREEIRVHGAAPVLLEVQSGPQGLLLRRDAAANVCWFGAWLAELPAATNIGLISLEHAGSVAEAIALAPGIGIPHQNALIGDDQGHIAWTIFGRVPEATGRERARGAGPWTTADDHPRIVDPPLGRLWSANARVTSDERAQQLIGGHVATLGAEYDLGARAGQIRDDLLALKGKVTPRDMLNIQLDDRALFLARWRTLLLDVLDAPALAGDARRTQFRRLVAAGAAEAAVDSVGYRLVRSFRDHTQQAVWDMLLAGLGVPAADAFRPPAQFEGPLWRLLTERPLHLLARRYRDWPEFLRAQVDATLADLARECPQLERCTWGARNLVRIRHPLSRALPALAGFLDMPSEELPGDNDMPRVQDGNEGASERFAVSPGRESEGYLHIPGGQSGHPLSPYYRAGFLAWARGQPLPFLPGPAQHTLTLAPE